MNSTAKDLYLKAQNVIDDAEAEYQRCRRVNGGVVTREIQERWYAALKQAENLQDAARWCNELEAQVRELTEQHQMETQLRHGG